LHGKAQTKSEGIPAVGIGVGIPYNEGFSSKTVLSLFKQHHHFEFRAEASVVLRTKRLVSANKYAGFVKETVKV
jgi:hypothetical protein